MKCIVTGGAGFIGSNLVDRLIDDGHEVIIIDNLSTGKKENINPKAVFHKQDIQYYNIQGVMQKDPDTSTYIETELTDTINISMINNDIKTKSSILNPTNPYSASKAAAEMISKWDYPEADFRSILASAVYGST